MSVRFRRMVPYQAGEVTTQKDATIFRVRLPEGGAVLTVDLDKMEIIELTGVRGGHVPGNLICHQDCVISQNSDRLQCFYQHRSLEAQIAKALEENAADPEALLRQGEILFDRGDATDAVQLFRRVATAFSQQAEAFLGKGDPGRHGEALATSLYARDCCARGCLRHSKIILWPMPIRFLKLSP